MSTRVLFPIIWLIASWQHGFVLDFDSEQPPMSGFSNYKFEVVNNPYVVSSNSSKLVAKISRPPSVTAMGGVFLDLRDVVDVVGDAEVSFDFYAEEQVSFIDIKLEESDIKSFAVVERLTFEQSQKKWIRVSCRFTDLNGYFSRLVIVPGFSRLSNGNEMWIDNVKVMY